MRWQLCAENLDVPAECASCAAAEGLSGDWFAGMREKGERDRAHGRLQAKDAFEEAGFVCFCVWFRRERQLGEKGWLVLMIQKAA